MRASYLVRVNFASETLRLWTGAGFLTAGGETWEGVEVASISGLQQAVNGEATQASFVLSGVSSRIVTLARDEWEVEAKGRNIEVLIQFHNDANDLPLETYDQPYSIWAGEMQTPSFDLEGPNKRAITIVAESLFPLRARPAFGQYTEADQQARFAGDRGFELVPGLLKKVVTWPDF